MGMFNGNKRKGYTWNCGIAAKVKYSLFLSVNRKYISVNNSNIEPYSNILCITWIYIKNKYNRIKFIIK